MDQHVPDLPSAALQRIIPIAEGRVARDIALTLTSLELYAGGFYLNLRLDWDAPTGLIPQIAWKAWDNRDNTYTSHGCAGSGDGPRFNRPGEGERPHSWRMGCSFSPAIDPKATRLMLELASLKLLVLPETQRPGMGDVVRLPRLLLRRRRARKRGGPARITATDMSGRWRFKIDLRPANVT